MTQAVGTNRTDTKKNIRLLELTQSVCPACLDVIEARIVVKDNAVFMEKTCAQHGPYSTYLWPDEEHYRWMKDFKFPHIRPQSNLPVLNGCPEDCGPCTAHQHHPRLVELELTQRCNLRCPVCFMAADDNQTHVETDLSLADIKKQLVKIMDQCGPQTSIQLTGGEPTVRKDLPDIIALCREIGFSAIEVNTNGVVISRNLNYLEQLAASGATGIYMQFDGLDDDVFKKVRGANLLKDKLQAIENCRRIGMQIVLAMAVIRGINDEQMGKVLEFGLKNRDVIAGVAFQPAFGSGRFEITDKKPLTMGDAIYELSEQSNGLLSPYDFWPTGCSHPLCDATTYILPQPQGLVPMSRVINVQDYMDHFNPASPQGSVLPDIADTMYPDHEPGLSILIMNYMDAMSMDLKRLQQCSMTVAGKDGSQIPFCSYQLTNIDGLKRSELA
ncbi:radical SAM protein [Desulfuromonas acetoxidans]|uniref:Radical SAM n=1 Tax=Desulfuromonas acetoxidans (strain DSM 684 / 11070) TaxID=281689 RepID=Q1K2I5_DESA6|nr:Radical SAM [Desulfuromonas acetoxidans DSM 684]MBF0645526.1 radical SAM protein [Desulfuromonas acetoxidans]NVD23842.1 radical SAM protein [Desulfuromonas acetoxidans]NVE15761.1 radical SAM protein [Desulfuromonas acetoxidans]